MKNNIVFAAVIALLLVSCGNQPQTSGPKSELSQPGAHLIHLSADQIKRTGIEWGVVENRNISATLPLTGELRIHPEHRAIVSAQADGFITDLRVRLNQPVRKGDVLAVLRKPDLVDLQQQFLENRDRLAFLQTERDRYAALKTDNATAAKNLQKAEADLRAATTTGQLLAAKLWLYGVDPEQLTPATVRAELQIVAPLNGVVTMVHLSAGSAVQAGAPVCEVANFSELHADLFVFEKDILKIKNGQRADITFPGAPGKSLKATVFSIDRVLDPAKNALRVHARLDDTGGLTLTDGVYLDARLTLDAPALLPALPSDAIVREGLEEFILVLDSEKDGAANFKAIRVKNLGTVEGFTAFEPETALPAEAKVVRRGAYFVWSQGKVEEFAEEE
ncbi:MAG: hypothetical protein EPGJADBJ_03720 [Saprospiraceae bacterium]|nr:hypothetical protein [Saprospiraceae bacterium]